MNVNYLLLEDQYYKYLILNYLEINKNQYYTLNRLIDGLSLSRYKIEKYIQDLNDEMQSLDPLSEIQILSPSEVQVKGVSYATVKKLRINYLEESTLFKLLHNYLLKEQPLDRQIEDLHMSRSAAYNQHRELKRILNEDGVKIKKNKIVGQEFQLRTHLFSLYYEAFNGVHDPFPTFIQVKSNEIITALIALKETVLPETKRVKLLFFLNIWLVRIRTKHFVDESFTTIKESPFKTYLKQELSTNWEVPPSVIDQELSFLFLFIHLEGINEKEIEYFKQCEKESVAEAVSQSFLTRLNQEYLLKTSEQRDLLEELKDINRKWLIYHFRESTFILEIKFHYFQEINPKLDRIVNNFLDELNKKKLFYCEEERNKLYYDYLFFLVAKLPVSKTEKPLIICIDFSHGTNYNEYIQLMLSSLQSMNIEYSTKISRETDIYISDCLIENLACSQLIWKNPPTSNDWKELGEMLVKLKGEKDG